MLITEIKREPIKTKSPKAMFIPQNLWKRFDYIGGGMGAGLDSSEIFLDLKHPNRVLKVVPIADLQDSYYRYLRMIEKHQHNPYFPKIYGMKVYDHSEEQDRYYLYVFMEKLLPMKSLSQEKVHFLMNRIGIPYTGKVKNDLSLRDMFTTPEQRKGFRQTTPDPNFVKALRLLEPMFKQFRNDLHIDNLMLRKTSGEFPQIVIVDPFWPSSM